MLVAPSKPNRGTFSVTKRLLDENTIQTNTTASTKVNKNSSGDTTMQKEKKNSAAIRN